MGDSQKLNLMNFRVSILLIVVLTSTVLAGTNGILEGVITDKKTNEKMPGVTVLVTGTQQGGTSNNDGYYQVQNLRAGAYDVRFSYVGYSTLVIKNVLINPDVRTKLNVQLDPSDVQMSEIVVVQEKPAIQRDVTGTNFSFSGE